MVKIASVAQSVAAQVGGETLTSTSIARFPQSKLSQRLELRMTYEHDDMFAPTIAPGRVHQAYVNCIGMIVVLTADTEIKTESSTIPTVGFLREMVYALESARYEAWSTNPDAI